MTKAQQNAIIEIANQVRRGQHTRRTVVPHADFPYILNTGYFLLRYKKEIADIRFSLAEPDTSQPERHFLRMAQQSLELQQAWSWADLQKVTEPCVKLSVVRPDGMVWTSYVDTKLLQLLLTVLGKQSKLYLSPDPLDPVYLSAKEGDALLSPIPPSQVFDFADRDPRSAKNKS